jgi:hypothetical protein
LDDPTAKIWQEKNKINPIKLRRDTTRLNLLKVWNIVSEFLILANLKSKIEK